jgi:hypothetical protein
MPNWWPSMAPGSASPGSQSSPFSSPTLPDRSVTPPLAAYCATCVLPTSITSGGSVLASAPVTFSVMPSHSCIWMVSVYSGWSRSNSASKLATYSSVAVSFISQTVRFCGSPGVAPGSSEPHAARAGTVRASASRPAAQRCGTGSPHGCFEDVTNW